MTETSERKSDRIHRIGYGRASITFFMRKADGFIYSVSSYSYRADGETKWADGVSTDLLLDHAKCAERADDWWKNSDDARTQRQRSSEKRRANAQEAAATT